MYPTVQEDIKNKDYNKESTLLEDDLGVDNELHHFRSQEVLTPYPANCSEKRASIYFLAESSWRRFIDESNIRRILRYALFVVAFVSYNLYVTFAVVISWKHPEKTNDVQLLVSVTLIAYAGYLYYSAGRKRLLRPGWRLVKIWFNIRCSCNKEAYQRLRTVVWCLLYGGLLAFLIYDTQGQPLRRMSVLGVLLIIAFGYVFSAKRQKVKWRPVIWGVFIQYVFGLIAIRWSFGQTILGVVETKILDFISYADKGSSVVYGYLVTGHLQGDINTDSVFMYKSLMVIVFISVFSSVLYHYGIMQRVVVKIGWILEKTMGTTCCESMAVSANMILSMPEACLTIKPYMEVLTLSEMHAVLTGGFATIACNVFVAYVRLGVRPNYLLLASVLSPPASLAFSKLFYPETEPSKTRAWNIFRFKGDSNSCTEAIVTGAVNGMTLILKLAGNLIGFVTCISFLNYIPGWFGSLVNMPFLSAKWIMSKLFWPIPYVMGVEKDQCHLVAWLIAVNYTFTNMAGFKIMGDMLHAKQLTKRSELLATFSICGFCNLSSVGVAFGTLSSLVPERKSELSGIVMRAMVAGLCACLMSASVVGSISNEFDEEESSIDFSSYNATEELTPWA